MVLIKTVKLIPFSFIVLKLLLSYYVSADNIKIPIASNNVKGWISLEDVQGGVNFQFDLQGLPSGASAINWALSETPLIIGEDKCSKAKNGPFLLKNSLNVESGGKILNQTVKINGSKTSDFDVTALILTVKNNASEILACANVVAEATKLFHGRFYGPEVAGPVYVFVNPASGLMKIHTRVINANNFDAKLKWSLKKYWWLTSQDAEQPDTLFCKEKANSAYVWYEPKSDGNGTIVAPIYPELSQTITLSNLTTPLSVDELSASVFVLDKIKLNEWEKPTLGCAKLRQYATVTSFLCQGNPAKRYQLTQRSPFHPTLIELLDNGTCAPDTSVAVAISKPENQMRSNANAGSLAFDAVVAQPETDGFSDAVEAVAKFLYPIAGEIYFRQPRNNPDSFTVVSGRLQSLFDAHQLQQCTMGVMKSATGWDLDAMTCARFKDLFNPSMIAKDFCRVSASTCPIGQIPYNFTIEPFNTTTLDRRQIRFVSRNLPLDGPFSIMGQTLQINMPWGQACANITLFNSSLLPKYPCDLPIDDLIVEASKMNLSVLGAQFSTNESSSEFLKGNVYLVQDLSKTTSPSPQYTGFFIVLSGNTKNVSSNYVWDMVENITTCSVSETYNPFGIETSQANTEACKINPFLCALGDVQSKVVKKKSNNTMCLAETPLFGYYGLENKVLRLRLGDTVYCSVLRPLSSSDIIFKSDSKLSNDELRKIIAQQTSLDASTINVANESVAKQNPTCSGHRLTIFSPSSVDGVKENLMQQIFNASSLSKILHSVECNTNGGRSFSLDSGMYSNHWMFLILIVALLRLSIL